MNKICGGNNIKIAEFAVSYANIRTVVITGSASGTRYAIKLKHFWLMRK